MNAYFIALAVIAYLIIGIFIARWMLLDGWDEVSINGEDFLVGILVAIIWPPALVAIYLAKRDRPLFTLRRKKK